ncbi:MAG: DUF4861 domain-containing protein [Rikenellaceae bacterium]|jgi:hypothetical protein|nr:DUF4861 domain-containing protein [Rikenellaceae bacterium]
MSKLKIVLALLFCFVVGSAFAQVKVETRRGGGVVCYVKNPNSVAMTDVPVVLQLENKAYKGALVMDGDVEIASQFDVLDNGVIREVSFVVDLKPKQTRVFKVYFSVQEVSAARYKYRTGAQMFLREDGQTVPMDEISATEDNMYNKVYPHGPAFESELAAYRIYFDQKQTVDIYGKVIERLELPDTDWYPSDQQLIDKYGDDVLYVGGTAGVGTLKGWDGQTIRHIVNMDRRTARILAQGPVRTIVEMEIEGWDYQDRKIGLTSRYTLYAGHRDAEVLQRFTGDTQGLDFATGVQKIYRRSDVKFSDGKGLVADWGRDFPVTDTVKYPQQTVGMAVNVPEKYVVREAEDKQNYLYIVRPDANNEIRYGISFAAQKEEFGYKTPEQFFEYVRAWKALKPATVTVK